jgi:hypothetical protein
MPQCKHCGTTLATGQMRHSPKGGYICRDKEGCRHDRKIRAQGGEPGPRSLQSLFRF